jgi:hypothetical protein
MDKVTMLARLRTFIDEESEVFYDTDAELYPALSLAQRELSKAIADTWKAKGGKVPLAIAPLITTEALTFSAPLPNWAQFTGKPLQIIENQFQKDGAITVDSPFTVEINQSERGRLTQNGLLSDGYYHWFTDATLFLHPVPASPTSANAKCTFIDTPVDITASVDPETDECAHDAIIQRALWILLKDGEATKAQAHLQLYTSLLQGLIQ